MALSAPLTSLGAGVLRIQLSNGNTTTYSPPPAARWPRSASLPVGVWRLEALEMGKSRVAAI